MASKADLGILSLFIHMLHVEALSKICFIFRKIYILRQNILDFMLQVRIYNMEYHQIVGEFLWNIDSIKTATGSSAQRILGRVSELI